MPGSSGNPPRGSGHIGDRFYIDKMKQVFRISIIFFYHCPFIIYHLEKYLAPRTHLESWISARASFWCTHCLYWSTEMPVQSGQSRSHQVLGGPRIPPPPTIQRDASLAWPPAGSLALQATQYQNSNNAMDQSVRDLTRLGPRVLRAPSCLGAPCTLNMGASCTFPQEAASAMGPPMARRCTYTSMPLPLCVPFLTVG